MQSIHGIYLIQGIQSGCLLLDEKSKDDKEEAITEARIMLNDLADKGACVRVITHDHKVVWQSGSDT